MTASQEDVVRPRGVGVIGEPEPLKPALQGRPLPISAAWLCPALLPHLLPLPAVCMGRCYPELLRSLGSHFVLCSPTAIGLAPCML